MDSKMGYINRSGNYTLEEFGIVHVNVRADARTIRARWKGERLTVSAPKGIEYDRLLEVLRGFGDKLKTVKPASMHNIGQQWQFPYFSVEMQRSPDGVLPDHITFSRRGENHHIINVGANIDLTTHSGCEVASRAFCRLASLYGPQLLKRAKEVGDILGAKPRLWAISRGHRTLGHCNRAGVISLSYVLTMYPDHLRDHVICHELAHLQEMNHSAAFHALCDAYCRRLLDRTESSLITESKTLRLPIVK